MIWLYILLSCHEMACCVPVIMISAEFNDEGFRT